MRDMRTIYEDELFNEALKKFKNTSSCKWSIFKDSFIKFVESKCPICEDTLNRYDDIDHFRPKAKGKYSFLECCYKNYMIMCSDCNRAYKNSKFPLYDSFKAENMKELESEKPLLTNPTFDNIYDLFELEFLTTIKSKKSILIIKPKDNLNDYEYQKALKTIEVYGIGDCDENSKIDDCRIEILEQHFEKFLKLAKVVDKYFKDKTNKLYKRRVGNILKEFPKLRSYGLYQFIIKNQFKISV